MRMAPARMPSARVRGERGITRTSRRAVFDEAAAAIASARGFSLVDIRGARFGALWRPRVRLARTMEQEFVVGSCLILVAHELESAIERLNRRLYGTLGVPAPKLQLVDVVIELFQATLRFLQQQIGASLRLTQNEFGLGLRRLLHFLGDAVRRQ